MNFKEITGSTIEATRMLFHNSNKNPQIIEIQCQKYKLTSQFMDTFLQSITKELFSNSPLLSYDLIKRYPDLFDINIWLLNPNKSLEPLLHDDFVETYGKETLTKAFSFVDYSLISKDVFEKFYPYLSAETITKIVNKNTFTDEEFLIKYATFLNFSIFRNRDIKVQWSNSLIEKILQNKLLTVRFLIAILKQTQDVGFIKRMLSEPFQYQISGETFDAELKEFIFRLHDDYMVPLFELIRKYSPNAASHDVLNTVLDFKNFLSEEFIIDNATVFFANGLKGRLASYARERNYDSVLVLLRLQD